MRIHTTKKFLTALLLLLSSTAFSTKLIQFQVIDNQHLMILYYDGEVLYTDDGLGAEAYNGHSMDTASCYTVTYGDALNTSIAQMPGSWALSSATDANYSSSVNPLKSYRQSKVNGAKLHFDGDEFFHSYTHQHTIYLELGQQMQPGHSYTLNCSSELNTDSTVINFTYNNFHNISEAIHLNLNGFNTLSSIKTADVYMWLGNGNYRDYSAFEGNSVYLYNTDTHDTTGAGELIYFTDNGADVGYYNLIQSPVWTCDFSEIQEKGNYKLVVEGIGSSQPFSISDTNYYAPYAVAVQGYYYMRLGEDSTNSVSPVPRRPLFIPHQSPADARIIITNFSPDHSEWGDYSGDRWDRAEYFENYILPGAPENTKAVGGHSDAYDWDRHLGHVSNIYDMLLPYIITGGGINDDNTGIAESGNGIPDLLDEVRNEVDFWLSLRYKGGYSHGVSCPHNHQKFYNKLEAADQTKSHTMYQAGNTPHAAWANAMNSAMLSNCFMLSGDSALMKEYRDSAIVAYNYASNLNDQKLNAALGIADGFLRGKDMKMGAAAFLYNVTGDTQYENVINSISECTSPTSVINNYGAGNSYDQTWATAAYLFTNRDVNYPELYENMKASFIYQAKQKEANNILQRPSRRATNMYTGYFKTAQNVQRTIVAHAITNDPQEKKFFEDALILEADWGLGRNPLNYIEMTTASTSLGKHRSIENIYTTGHDDGTPGLHPGHTPYLNTDGWYCGMESGCPPVLTDQCYPSYSQWPQSQGYFNVRYFWAHSEFTPRQTMRGKFALYAYLYANYNQRAQENKVYLHTSANNGIVLPGEGIFDMNDTLTLSAIPDRGYEFSHWSGDIDTTANPVFIHVDSNMTVIANFSELPSYSLSVINGQGSGDYYENEEIEVEANIPSYYSFNKWVGDTITLENTNTSISTLVMPGENTQIEATFTEFDKYRLTINNGQGSGTYYETEIVNIIAHSADDGFAFEKWIGDTLTLRLTDRANTYLTMPSNDIEVTATFKQLVGIELVPAKQRSLSPNPCSNGTIFVNGTSVTGNYKVFDTEGKLYLSGEINNNAIDISSLNTGSYLLIGDKYWARFIIN